MNPDIFFHCAENFCDTDYEKSKNILRTNRFVPAAGVIYFDRK